MKKYRAMCQVWLKRDYPLEAGANADGARGWTVTLQSTYVQFSAVTSGASSGLTVLT